MSLKHTTESRAAAWHSEEPHVRSIVDSRQASICWQFRAEMPRLSAVFVCASMMWSYVLPKVEVGLHRALRLGILSFRSRLSIRIQWREARGSAIRMRSTASQPSLDTRRFHMHMAEAGAAPICSDSPWLHRGPWAARDYSLRDLEPQ